MSAQVAADLRAAAEVLRRDGWTQGNYGSVLGCKCVFGALHYVASDGEYVADDALDMDEEGRANLAGDFLAEQVGVEDYSSIPVWNDAPGRTADEVIAALEAAADAAGGKP